MSGRQAAAKLGHLDPRTTIFLLCDVQEKFRLVMRNFSPMITNTQKLLDAGRILNVDLIASEQYPEKLGQIVPELNITHAIGIYPKLTFSMATDNDSLNRGLLLDAIKQRQHIRSIVLFGLEAHVCVEQTAMDLLGLNYVVHVVADCTISRNEDDRRLAFERLRQIGCFINTSESVIFKLMKSKEHNSFNDVRKLVAQPSADTGLAKL